jgi:glyoxylate reductase
MNGETSPGQTRPRILVPQPIQPEGLALLREVGEVEVIETDRMLSRDELIAGLKRCDYLLAIGDQHITADILDANPNLRGIAFAAGHPGEWMDVDACTARGIPLTEISRQPVTGTTAELTMALLLGCAWRLVEADAYTRAGKFRQEQSTLLMCHSLAGKTLGLVGLGGVGRLVAPRARAFDLRLLYTKRTRLSALDEAALGVEWVPELDDLLRASDFVSLHAAHNRTSERMIGRRDLDLL